MPEKKLSSGLKNVLKYYTREYELEDKSLKAGSWKKLVSKN